MNVTDIDFRNIYCTPSLFGRIHAISCRTPFIEYFPTFTSGKVATLRKKFIVDEFSRCGVIINISCDLNKKNKFFSESDEGEKTVNKTLHNIKKGNPKKNDYDEFPSTFDTTQGPEYTSAAIEVSMNDFILPCPLEPNIYQKLISELSYSILFRVDLYHMPLEILGIQINRISSLYSIILNYQYAHHFQIGLCGKTLWNTILCVSFLVHQYENKIHITAQIFSESKEILIRIKNNSRKWLSDLLEIDKIPAIPNQPSCSFIISNELSFGFSTKNEKNLDTKQIYMPKEEIESKSVSHVFDDVKFLQAWRQIKNSVQNKK